MYEQLKLENQICFRLYTVSRLMTQAYRPLLEPLGLTYPQYLVMMVLWEKDNLFVGDIAQKLQLETNTVTPLLQRMEQQGLLVRQRGPVDSRQTLVSLTKKGKQLEESAKSVPNCLVNNLLSANGQTQPQGNMEAFIAALDQMIGTLQKTNCPK